MSHDPDDPADADPVDADPVHADPVHADPVHADPVHAGPLPDPGTDPVARALRDALAARADAVQPADRLQEIRMSTTARRRSSRAWAAATAAAAVVVVGGGTALALTRGEDASVRTVASRTSAPTAEDPATTPPPEPATEAPVPAEPPQEPAATSTPAAPGTGAPAPSTTAPAPATGPALPSGARSVPVYWLDGASGSTWLFREYVEAAGEGDDADRALAAVLGGDPADPDYATAWAAAGPSGVSRAGDRLVVDLPAGAAPGSLEAPQAAAAVQQLVHTVTAAASEDLPVEIRVDGRAEPVLFGHAVPETVSRAPQAEVQAPAWITSTDTSTPGQVVVEGVGSGFEGTLLYVVTDATGAEVARGPVQAGANGAFAEFSVTIPLPAGEHVVEVLRPDESGGEAGTTPPGDTKAVTVR
ncbi:Gmad2 immunoglobulin-like domain-containing protein [Kineococcus gypseus]|uniref:Gmad2 immunoglobulin-like domain-containing protein n=1 Tax=Kineococcus gypseus TaxID=1637102 RepID=UPI003D7CAEB6